MKVTLRLSGSIRLIYRELNENITMNIDYPISIKNLLYKVGITPILAPMVLVDGEGRDKDFIIDKEEVEVTVIGPLAGG